MSTPIWAAKPSSGHARGDQSARDGAPERLEDPPEPAGTELRWVTDEAGIRDFLAVNSVAYASLGMPVEVLGDLIVPGPRFLEPHVQTVVAYLEDEPVAAAQTLLSHGIAGVYWVGTVEAARGKGLAESVTRAVTNRAFDLGAGANTLQASPMGGPIYLRMGYETIYHYTDTAIRARPLSASTLTSGTLDDVGGADRANGSRPWWYHAALEQLTDFVVVTDAAGTILWVNPFVERLLGFGNDDSVGSSIADFVHPDDLMRAAEVMTLMADEQLGVPLTPAVYRIRSREGTWTPVELNGTVHQNPGAGSVVDDDDRVVVIVGRYSGDRAFKIRSWSC